MTRPSITFLTDWGLDTAPATCRGVIWSICPEARINDLSHTARQFGIRDAAFLLWSSLPYQPIGVHLAVVDPGVGTSRRPIALRTRRGDHLVGPDNGLLRPAAERLGGIEVAHVIENRAYWRDTVSHTFHGRDIFAPVAAHLANGVPIGEIGPAVAPGELVPLTFPAAEVVEGTLRTSVLFVDAFGNCRLAGSSSDLATLAGSLDGGDRFRVAFAGREEILPWHPTFGAVGTGQTLLYEDADYAGLAVAVNQGSAADRLGLAHDVELSIRPV